MNFVTESRENNKASKLIGVARLFKGTRLYNVRGSGGRWVKIKNNKYEPIKALEKCIDKKYYCNCSNKNCEANKNTKIVGAHITCEKMEEDIKDGQPCFIIPLCKNCNDKKENAKIELSNSMLAIVVKF